MAALRFLSTLPEVKADDLTKDSCCDRCLRPYGTVETKDEIAEVEVERLRPSYGLERELISTTTIVYGNVND